MEKNNQKLKKKSCFFPGDFIKIIAIIVMFIISTPSATALLESSSIISDMPNIDKNIVWDATMTLTNTINQNDYVVFGEAPDAHDGPPADSYDVVKPPVPIPPYLRAWLDDNLQIPYDSLWMDYRHYPDTSKTWNLTVHWMPSSGSSPTTVTMNWVIAEIAESEYTNVTLCTNDGSPLMNMLSSNSYVFSCPAYVPQLFKIICQVVNTPPVANNDSASVIEDSSNNQINVLSNDYDPDNDEITIISVTQPSHGIATTNGDYCFYTPTLHYHGADSFTYTISDPYAGMDTATVLITVQAKQYYLIITIQGSGSVTKEPDQQSYIYGQIVNLTANPSSGWIFNHWGGDLSGYINPTTIAMTGNKSVIANFTQLNQPPYTPGKPNGPPQGSINKIYTYTAITTDNDSDKISYQFDWGDGSMSQWIGPFDSGVTVSASHTWTKKGSYLIKVKARDSHGSESAWSEALPITMPFSKENTPLFLEHLFDFLMQYFQGSLFHRLFINLLKLRI